MYAPKRLIGSLNLHLEIINKKKLRQLNGAHYG